MALLAPHFTTDELGYSEALPASVRANLRMTAQLLETFRQATGAQPFRVTSGYRTAAENEAVGGASSSGHLTGAAADFVPAIGARRFVSQLLVLEQLGEAPPYGELIAYTGDPHIHVTLPGVGGNRQRLIKTAGGYVPMTPELVAQLPGPALSTGVAVLLVALVLLVASTLRSSPRG